MNAKTSKKALDEITKALNSMAATSEKVAAATEKQTKAFNEMSKATKDATKATKDADSELKRFKGNVEDTEDALTDVEKKMGKIKDQAAKFAKAAGFKASAKFEVKGFDKIGADLESYKDQLKDAQAQLKTMQEQDAGPGVFKDAQRGIQELNQKIRGLEGELKIVGDEFKTSLEVPRTPTRALGNINQGVEGIGSAFGALKKSPMEFAEHMESAQAAAHKLKASSAIIGKMPGLLGAMGKAAAGVAGAMGGITKVLAGWPGLVAMAVIKIVQAGVEIDTYLKTLNKRFAEIRGPQIMTGDLKKQFNDFNNAIFSLGDNIRDGLNADQVYDFMAALGTTGKRLTTLNEGFSNYRDAVHIAAKASKVFGMDITTVGAMMGRFTSDFGMNLENVDDAFVQLSFDAQRSGLSTDRFLGAIENASVGLSFYGSFIGTASRMMSEFTKTQVMGAKDAADATQDITQAFGKMTTQEGMALLQVSGTYKEAMKAFEGVRDEAMEKAQIKGEEIVKLSLEKPETAAEKEEIAQKIDQARIEQNKNLEISARAQSAINGKLLGMGQNIGLLTDKAPAFFLELIKKVTGGNGELADLNAATAEVRMRGVEAVTNGKLNAKQVQKLTSQVIATGATLKVVTGALDLSGKGNKVNNKTLVGFLKKINKTIVKGDKYTKKNGEETIAANEQEAAAVNEENKKNADLLVQSLEALNTKKAAEANALNSADAAKKAEATAKAVNNTTGLLQDLLGVDETAAKSLATAATLDKGFNTGMQKLITASIEQRIAPEQMQKEMNDLISKTGIQTKYAAKQFTADKTVAKDEQKAYDDTFKGVRDMTLSIEDMKKMAKDEIAWRSLSVLQDISNGISTMATAYADKAQTIEMKRASEALKNVGLKLSGSGENKRIKSTDGKGIDMSAATYTKELMTQNDNSKNQAKIAQKGLEKLEKNEEGLSADEINVQKKKHMDTIAKATKQITQNEDTLKLLKTAGAADDVMIELFTAQLKGSAGTREAFLDVARKKFGDKKSVTVSEMEEAFPMIGKNLVDSFRKEGKVTGGGLNIKTGIYEEEKVNLDPTPIPAPAVPVAAPAKQGLKTPEEVTKKGYVILHPGETILPKFMSGFKTEIAKMGMMKPPTSGFSIPAPKIMDQPKATAAATPITISINVSADTKDLAQQIATVAKNEIRGYFYNNSVNNQA